MRRLSYVAVGLGTVAALVTASGCGSSSAATEGISVPSLDRALLTNAGPPRPSTVGCRAPSAAERSAAPFQPTKLSLFTCELTFSDERSTFAVQVLDNGCFVAERHRPGQAVYGCGVHRS